MKYKKNDEVVVIAGKEKGRVGRITRVDIKNNKVFIKDLNMQTKHKKPTQGQDGSIKKFEGPIDASNISILVKKATKTSAATFSKLGYKINKDGSKVRIIKATKKELV